MIMITDRASSKIKSLATGQVLRIAVTGGGCSGMSYKLSWVPDADAADSKIPFGPEAAPDFYVVIDPRSALFLKGMELDHSDGLDGIGFSFNNPNARRVCGCGSSFSA